jgi:hypothetical protein
MGKSMFAVLSLLLALAMFAPGALADNGKGHGKGKGNPHNATAAAEQGWQRRGDYEYRTYGRDERPPGWGDCDLPPGQAKKYGCRTYDYQGRRHYYYRDEQGRIIVRRPVAPDSRR